MSNSFNKRFPDKTIFDKYYEQQAGGSISSWYKGTPNQRGHGVGSFLGGLFRHALPLLKSGARSIGKEFLQSGINVLNDMGSEDKTLKSSLKEQGIEAVDNLKRKAKEKVFSFLKGEGYKMKRKRKSVQSKKKKQRRKTSKSVKAKPKRKSRKTKIKRKLKKNIQTKKTKNPRKRKTKSKSRNKFNIISHDIFT